MPQSKTTKKPKAPARKGGKRKGAASKSKKKNKTIGNKTNTPRATARKPRSDNTASSVNIAQNAFREIEPPEHVRFRNKDYIFWDEIISKIAKADWDDESLTMAAMLARTMADLEKEQHIMRQEGSVLKRMTVMQEKQDNGDVIDKLVVTGQYTNPRKTVVDMHTKNILAMRRSLALHARGTDGEARESAHRRASNKSLENNILQDDDDDLLAKPTLQ